MLLQIVGELNCVKKAIAIISDPLKESLHRDHGPSVDGIYQSVHILRMMNSQVLFSRCLPLNNLIPGLL
jgi:hypothetical protein